MTTTPNKKLIVVLGMHRSGTSAVARALKVLNVQLGDHLMAANTVNTKGFWEDIDLNALNIEMMSAINTEWHHLAPIQQSDVDALRKAGFFPRAEKLLREKMKGRAPFGFKDPRTAKLLPFWKAVFAQFKYDVSYVLVSRQPLSIVKSLTKRDGFEPEKSYLLWLVHMLESLAGTSTARRVLVDYDRLMRDPDRELDRMAQALGLEVDLAALAIYKSEFLDASLRHSVFDQRELAADPACPPLVRDVYGALVEVASDKLALDSKKLQQNLAKWAVEFTRVESALKLADKLYTAERFHAALYLATKAQAFSEERCISLSISMDEAEVQTVHVAETLPGISRLRLDPCDGFDVIYLGLLEFLSKSGKIIRVWNGVPDAEIAMGVAIMDVPGTPGWALICPENDPWIEFKLPEGTHSLRLAMRRLGPKPLADLLALAAKSETNAQSALEEVAARDERIRTLFESVSEREIKIASLNQALEARDGQITNISQTAAERETQLVARNEGLAVSLVKIEMLSSREQALNAEVGTLQAEKSQLWQLLLEAVRASATREQEVAAQHLAREREIAESQAAREREIAEQQNVREREIAEQQTGREREIAEQQTAREQTHNVLVAAREQEHAMQLSSREQEHAMQLSSREQQYAMQLTGREREIAEQQTAREQTHNVQVAAREQEHAMQLSSREQQYAMQLTAREQELRTQMATLQNEMKEVQQALLSAAQASIVREQEFASQRAAVEHAHAAQFATREQELHSQMATLRAEVTQVQQALLAAAHASTAREQAFAAQFAAGEQAHASQLTALHEETAALSALREKAFALQLSTTRREATQLAQQLETLLSTSQRELALVRGTLSWRLSAPFRRVAAVFGKSAMPAATTDVNQVGALVPLLLEQRATGSNDPSSFSGPVHFESPHMTGMRHAHVLVVPPKQLPRACAEELLEKEGDAFIDAIYIALMQRTPDPEGKRYYQQRLEAGVSKLQVLHEIYASEESRATGVQISGLWEAIANVGLSTVDAFFLPTLIEETGQIKSAEELLRYEGDQLIQYAYFILLKRPADVEGMRACLDRLRTGASKSQVVYDLFTSVECSKTGSGLPGIREAFLNENAGKTGDCVRATAICRSTVATNLSELVRLDGSEFVECAYLTLLKRPPDAAGFRDSIARLLDGDAKIQILADMVSSQEGRAAGVVLPGLPAAIVRLERVNVPLIGGLFRLFAREAGGSELARRVRATEQQLVINRQNVDLRVYSVERGLASAHQLMQLGESIHVQIDKLDQRIAKLRDDAEARLDHIEPIVSKLHVAAGVDASVAPEAPVTEEPAGKALVLPDADGTWEWSAYGVVKERIQSFKRLRKESLVPEPLKLIGIGDVDFDEAAKRIVLPAPGKKPSVSIIIPVFNNLKLTLECLLSITNKTAPSVTYEVLVADDASTDATVNVLSKIANLRLIRNPQNIGFLLNCNRALDAVRGNYVVFLNNDVQVSDGWLKGLLDTFTKYPNVGAVGPRFVYPSGHLQEAGAALRPDGSADMIGLNEDAEQPRYSYVRRVDYTSGACLMLPTPLAKELGGFSEEFLPCYCEDSDLCLRVQEKGYFVYYNPAVTIVHYLSKTTVSVDHEFKYRCVSSNLSTLANKWMARIDKSSTPRVLAFYLPQFHPFPENSAWWGEGFTEWTNVSKARPNFVGHYQPRLPADLGYYDLRVSEVMAQQAELARNNGIDGFCFYYYWFGGKRLLELPIEQMLESKKPVFPFCLCWANENWSRRWDGQDSEILMAQAHSPQDDLGVIADLSRFFRDVRYIRIDGRPLILVYRVPLFPDFASTAARWRQYCREEGVGEIYIAMVESFDLAHSQTHPSNYGCDAAVEFPPQELAETKPPTGAIINPQFHGHTGDYNDLAVRFATRELPPYTRFMGVVPGWDNTARMQDRSFCFEDATPGAFQAWLEQALDETRAQHYGDERLVFVNAWNEWAEGTYLEPDRRFGHAFLEAVRNAKDAARLLRKGKYGLGG